MKNKFSTPVKIFLTILFMSVGLVSNVKAQCTGIALSACFGDVITINGDAGYTTTWPNGSVGSSYSIIAPGVPGTTQFCCSEDDGFGTIITKCWCITVPAPNCSNGGGIGGGGGGGCDPNDFTSATSPDGRYVTICHHTHSAINPVLVITININSLAAHVNNHGDTNPNCGCQ